MELRKELSYPTLDESVVESLKTLVTKIEDALEAKDEVALEMMQSFNDKTERNYDEYTFRSYYGSVSLDQFVRDALAKPEPGGVDVTREELIEIVRRAMPGQPGFSFEREAFYMELFDALVSYPSASGLITHPPDDRPEADWDPTPEEVVEIALDHEPKVTMLGPVS
jgi:hypothetical protein